MDTFKDTYICEAEFKVCSFELKPVREENDELVYEKWYKLLLYKCKEFAGIPIPIAKEFNTKKLFGYEPTVGDIAGALLEVYGFDEKMLLIKAKNIKSREAAFTFTCSQRNFEEVYKEGYLAWTTILGSLVTEGCLSKEDVFRQFEIVL